MRYQVVVHRSAAADLHGAYAWAAKRAPMTAARWLNRFEQAIQTLSHHPERCVRAREDGKVDVPLRELHFGKMPYVFRVIFTVDGDKVRVLRIRRGQRRNLTKSQLESALRIDDETD